MLFTTSDANKDALLVLRWCQERCTSVIHLLQVKKGGQLVLFTISDTNKDPWIGPERLSRAAFSWYRPNH